MHLLACDMWLLDVKALQSYLGEMASVSINSEAARAAADVKAARDKNIATIPVTGPLESRRSFVGEAFGMASYEAIGNAFDAAMAEESIGTIVLRAYTPGGMVHGCPELANKIYQARGRKQIIGVADFMAASGGYWLLAACDRIIASPSADVGSVGVITERIDMTQALKNEGVKVDVFRSSVSPYKGEGNEMESMTEEAKARVQSRVDSIAGRFVSDLAKFRGVSVDHVKEYFGKGQLLGADDAKKAGMVDEIMPYDAVIGKLLAGRYRMGKDRAEDNWCAPTVQEERKEKVAAIHRMVTEVN